MTPDDDEFKRALFALPDAESCRNCNWFSVSSRRLDMVVYNEGKLPKEWQHIITFFCDRCPMYCARCGKKPSILVVFATMNTCPDCAELVIESMRRTRTSLRGFRPPPDYLARRA